MLLQRQIEISIGEYYHIYNRGTDKRVIFIDNRDYRRFIALLYASNSSIPVDIARHFRSGLSFLELFEIERGEQLVNIIVYCLMPNHFHLLIREKTEGGVQKFLGKLSTAYSMYFNKKNKRTGALFEGRFKAKHVTSDEYLKYLFAYIHLNPVKLIDPSWKEAGIRDRLMAQNYLSGYEHSSYLDYQGNKRIESKVINREIGPEYFTEVDDFDAFIEEWLSFSDIE